MLVLVPACIDDDGRQNGRTGWVVLHGPHHPAEAVCFCWSRERANAIHGALGGQTEGYWISPAALSDEGGAPHHGVLLLE